LNAPIISLLWKRNELIGYCANFRGKYCRLLYAWAIMLDYCLA